MVIAVLCPCLGPKGDSSCVGVSSLDATEGFIRYQHSVILSTVEQNELVKEVSPEYARNPLHLLVNPLVPNRKDSPWTPFKEFADLGGKEKRWVFYHVSSNAPSYPHAGVRLLKASVINSEPEFVSV